ncbi:GNAT family N-acetyltransferase [Actinopolymorpha sp. B17G11]|uniref:GNAT family N-acetyltransferase n=1 Tax=Actinopolymorpha sp. B17G11 TaxID=3160861 RepID=UPI0032E387FA
MSSHQIRFAELSRKAMSALLADDLATARAESGVELGRLFVDDRAKWLWNYRLKQLETEPEAAAWIARVVVAGPDGVVIGYAGYHGPPDDRGMVEVGYTVDPGHRRQGYATAILAALLERAAAEPAVQVVRASISPDNEASLATIAKFGFTKIGDQWDEEDGLELVFERPASPSPTASP